jgi:hypothetical protein
MSNATAQVHFTIVDDELEVSVPPALEPLKDFIETEIGTSDVKLDLIDHHLRHDRTWQYSGDACRLDLNGERATVKHSYTGAFVQLTRAELRDLLTTLRDLLTTHYG